MQVLAIGLAAALVVYNTVTNRTPTRDAVYLVRNLLVGTGLVAVALAAGLSPDELGLAPDDLGAAMRWAGLVVTAVAVLAATAAALADRVEPIGRALDDARADLEPQRLAFHVFVRIPLGTALFEEVAFRGVLLAAFAEPLGTPWAVAASSVAFGAWHVGPTRLAARLNGVHEPRAVRRRVVVAVLLTTLGGVGFALLRLASGSLLAPVAAHAAINGFSLLVAAAASPGRTGGSE